MDKVKAILGVLKKHHFWLLAVLCMVFGLMGWSMASSSLSSGYVTGKGKVTKAFDGLKAITDVENFPNNKWKDDAGKLTQEERKKVREAWQNLYDEQKKLLVWPKEVLGDSFVAVVEKLRPGDEIEPELRSVYVNQIPKVLPEVWASANIETEGSADSKDKAQNRVVWEAHSKIRGDFGWKTAPSSLEVWIAQENLWVYRALLNIIKNVNEGKYLPVIPQIDKLLIGEQAADELKRGLEPDHIQGSAQTAAGPGPAAAAAGPTGDGATVKPPDDGRYVDAAGNALAGGGAANKDLFKRMPIFLRLQIDQREITKLLVECANSPLPVEVQQLRINPQKNSAAGASPSPADAKTRGGSAADKEADSFVVPIELAGIIYIYNPPDNARLGGDPAAAPAASGVADPAAAGAAPPPAGAPLTPGG